MPPATVDVATVLVDQIENRRKSGRGQQLALAVAYEVTRMPNSSKMNMKKIIAALLGLAALEGIASAQTSPARIAYDACYALAGTTSSATSWRADPPWPGRRVRTARWLRNGHPTVRESRSSTGDILVVTLADGTIANLTNHLGGSSPAWSRDGGKIAFTSNRDGLTELYVMNADGSSVRRLTDHIGFNGRPAWSPDSSRIVFEL